MQSITLWRPTPITWPPSAIVLTPLHARRKGRLRLKPVAFLMAINALSLARWACTAR